MNEPLFDPPTTPEQWCETQPCLAIGGITFTQPFGSVLVYLLALLWVAGGVYYWRVREGQRSREWMSLALVLSGIGAGLAGTSYQLLGYELKCAGRVFCLWTNWLEVAYLMLQAASASAMLIAVAYACTSGVLRPRLLLVRERRSAHRDVSLHRLPRCHRRQEAARRSSYQGLRLRSCPRRTSRPRKSGCPCQGSSGTDPSAII